MNILITGGASGLGEAITNILAKDPKNTIYFTYSNSRSNALRIETVFKNTVAIKCDFKNFDEVQALVESINQLNLHVLINNAYSGEILPTHFHKLSAELFLTDFNDNIMPCIKITQEVIKNFRKRKEGKIITVLTSFLTNVPPIGLSSYVASKAYLEKLTKVWANENASFNITSNSISPSFMQTNLNSNVDERVIDQIKNSHPLKKILTVKEVAESVLFLVHASPHINGVDIMMNAGVNIK